MSNQASHQSPESKPNPALKIIIWVFGILLVALMVYAIASVKWEKIEQEIGLTQEAAYNPLLVANELLKQQGKTLTTLDHEVNFYHQDKIILSEQSSLILDEGSLKEHTNLDSAVLNWVAQGGHLIYTLSPRHEILQSATAYFFQETEITPVLVAGQGTKNHILASPTANVEFKYAGELAQLYLPYQYSFDNCYGEAYSAKPLENEQDDTKVDDVKINKSKNESKSKTEDADVDADEKADVIICDISYGEGYITFLPSINPISNMGIKHLDHGAFLLWLVGRNQSLFYLPSLVAPNWFFALWHWSWIFVVLAITSLILLVWQLIIRHGKGITPLIAKQTPFASHIEATGYYMFNHQHHIQLKQALLDDLNKKVESKIPNFKYLSLKAQSTVLSQISAIDPIKIQALLENELPRETQEKIEFIKLFKHLRKSL